MPRCQGRPESPCPDGRNDNSVHGTQGDLLLCHACDEYRFPTVRSDTRSTKVSKQSVAVNTNVEKKSGHINSASECEGGLTSTVPVIQIFMRACSSQFVMMKTLS